MLWWMSPTATPLFAAFLLVASCGGGGGGGTPLQNPPQLLLTDVDVPPGVSSGTLDLGLASEKVPPTMIQVDLVTDPTRIRLRPDVTMIADVFDLDAGLIEPGRLRVVFGDATTKDAPPALPVGALVRIPFDVVAGASSGVVEVRAEQPLASGEAGEGADLAEATVVGRITLR